MDYEKKYNEALERAKAVIEVSANQEEAKGIATSIFPELQENEDERIRKRIYGLIYHNDALLGTDLLPVVVAEDRKEIPLADRG